MAEPIITVEHLSKRYRISHQGQREQYATLRDVLAARSKSLLNSFRSRSALDSAALAARSSTEDFWALKDVSFDVKQGEVLGIIGRNGAGKSTLLKVLSRITDPTEGRVRIRGRVASLLEVGTGFHPELTGRENIFLNGAILGMSRAEIKRKFDEIVDFAGVEKFLDTPVKRYSSGMYVRLAFAVAAHLEPEILIVDEVLAVGDSEFQKKCLGKMQDVSAKEGRTVIFVSHNLDAITTLCDTAVYLRQGTKVCYGKTAEAMRAYLEDIDATTENTGKIWMKPSLGPGIQKVFVEQHGVVTDAIICGDEFTISLEIEVTPECRNHEVGVGFIDHNGQDILRENNKHLRQELTWPREGTVVVKFKFPYLNWIGGDHVYLGAYFGWVGDNYDDLSHLVKLTLVKDFKQSSADLVVPRVNKIFIDGVKIS